MLMPIAFNPDTGEAAVWTGHDWQAVPAVVHPTTGHRAIFTAGVWRWLPDRRGRVPAGAIDEWFARVDDDATPWRSLDSPDNHAEQDEAPRLNFAPRTWAELDALPSGAVFFAPDGAVRQKAGTWWATALVIREVSEWPTAPDDSLPHRLWRVMAGFNGPWPGPWPSLDTGSA